MFFQFGVGLALIGFGLGQLPQPRQPFPAIVVIIGGAIAALGAVIG